MNQKGFTLLELLVTIAISGVILLGVVISINQIVEGTIRSGNDVSVLSDINNATRILKEDLIMAQSTDLSATPKSSAVLSWTDFSSFQASEYVSHTVIYALSGTNLMRTYDDETSIAGRNISSISFTQVDRVITTVITATSIRDEQKSETLTLSSYIRTEGIPQ